jgi:hypothetical protein
MAVFNVMRRRGREPYSLKGLEISTLDRASHDPLFESPSRRTGIVAMKIDHTREGDVDDQRR